MWSLPAGACREGGVNGDSMRVRSAAFEKAYRARSGGWICLNESGARRSLPSTIPALLSCGLSLCQWGRKASGSTVNAEITDVTRFTRRPLPSIYG